MLALALAASLSPLPSALAQTTADSLADQFDEPKRLSVLGALGISLIEQVKVTAIALNEDGTEVTVTLNQTDTASTTTPAVTAVAFRTQLDLVSLLQAHMGRTHEMPMHPSQGFGQDDMMMPYQDQMRMPRGSSSGDMPMFDVISFIEKLQIGSNIAEEGWTSPIELTIPVISGDGEDGVNTVLGNTSDIGTASNPDTEVVIVVAIPYTGGAAGKAVGQIEELPTNLTTE